MADNSRVILITGSDSGIGLAIARKFPMEGYRIAMCGTDRRRGERALAERAEYTSRAIYFVADVRSEKQIHNLMRHVSARYNRLDVLCNNAGIQKLASIETLFMAVCDEVMAVNVRGTFLCTKLLCPI